MRSSFSKQNNSKLIIYTIVIAVIVGICAVVVQDIKVPTKHVSQEISVKLEK
jgi:hypothetical protein